MWWPVYKLYSVITGQTEESCNKTQTYISSRITLVIGRYLCYKIREQKKSFIFCLYWLFLLPRLQRLANCTPFYIDAPRRFCGASIVVSIHPVMARRAFRSGNSRAPLITYSHCGVQDDGLRVDYVMPWRTGSLCISSVNIYVNETGKRTALTENSAGYGARAPQFQKILICSQFI